MEQQSLGPIRKAARKSLSLLLSVLMVMGCVSAAFTVPTYATKTQIDQQNDPVVRARLTALRAAIHAASQAGALDAMTFSGNYSFAVSGNNQTINNVIHDNTPGGSLLGVAKAFDALLRTNLIVLADANSGGAGGSTTPYPYTWWTNLYRGLMDYFGFIPGSPEAHLLAALTNMKADNTTTLTLKPTLTAQNNNNVWFPIDNTGNTRANTNNYTGTYVNTKVVYEELALLRSAADYGDVLALPNADGLVSYQYGIRGTTARSGSLLSYRYHNIFLTDGIQAPVAVDGVSTSVIAFHDHFLTGLLDTDPYGDYSPEELSALVLANASKWGAAVRAGGVDTDDIDYLFGDGTAQEVEDFIDLCKEAEPVVWAATSISYFMDMPGGFNARIADGEHLDMEYTALVALWAAQQVYYDVVLSLSDELLALAMEHYGVVGPDLSAIDEARDELLRHIQVTELSMMKAELHSIIPDGFKEEFRSWFADYPGEVFPEKFREVLADYTNAEVVAFGAMFGADYASILSYPEERILDVFPGDTVNEALEYIEAFRLGLLYEGMFRGVEETAGIAFFKRVMSTNLAALTSNQLADMQKEALIRQEAYWNAVVDDALNAGLLEADAILIYDTNFPAIAAAFDKIYATMAGRLESQVDRAWALYVDGNDDITYQNVTRVRNALNGLDSVLYTVLSEPTNEAARYMPSYLPGNYLNLAPILDRLTKFLDNKGIHNYEDAAQKYKDARQYPNRLPYPEDFARSDEATENYQVDNALMNSAFEKLEGFLMSQTFEGLTGMDLEGTIAGALDGLWSDAMINNLLKALYPAVLNGLEDLFRDNLPSGFGEPGYDVSQDPMVQRCVLEPAAEYQLKINSFELFSLYRILSSTAANSSIKSLRLYPNLLAASLPPEFSRIARVLENAMFQNGKGWHVYRTDAWEDPVITWDFDWGVDEVPDDPEHPLYALRDLSKEERFRHAMAWGLSGVWDLLAALMCGQNFSLFSPNIGNADVSVRYACMNHNPIIQEIELYLRVLEGSWGYPELLTALFEGLVGFAPDNALVPSLAQLQAYGSPAGPTYPALNNGNRAYDGARALVDAIFDPLQFMVAEVVAQKPLSAVATILPNLAYSVVLDQVRKGLAKLIINLDIMPDGMVKILGINCFNLQSCGTCLCSGCDSLHYPYPFDVMNDAVGSSWREDFAFLGEEDRLFGCFAGTGGCNCMSCFLGGCSLSLPLMGFGDLLLNGEMTGPLDGTKRPHDTWYEHVPGGTVTVKIPDGFEDQLRDDLVEIDGFYTMGATSKFLADALDDRDGNPWIWETGTDEALAAVGLDEVTPVPLLDEFDGQIKTVRDFGPEEQVSEDAFGVAIPLMDEDGINQAVDEDKTPLWVYSYDVWYVYSFVSEYRTEPVWHYDVPVYRDQEVQLYERVKYTEPDVWYHIEPDNGDVLLYLLRYLFGALQDEGMRGILMGLFSSEDGGGGDVLMDILMGVLDGATANPDDAIAALVELMHPVLYAPSAIVYGQPLLAQAKYPDWWAGRLGLDDPTAQEKAKMDGDYVVANADVVLDILWNALSGGAESFSEGILGLLLGLLGDGMESLLDDLRDPAALEELLEGLDLESLLGTLDPNGQFLPLIGQLLSVNGQPLDVMGDPVAAVRALLDFLLCGASLELSYTTGDPEIPEEPEEEPEESEAPAGESTSLITVLGYKGYQNAIVPLLKAFTDPLGLTDGLYEDGVLLDQEGFESLTGLGEKLAAILAPLMTALDEAMARPVDALLSLLPNLVYFLSPDAGGGDSPLQQSIDALLHPLYVLLDTVRPIADVLALVGMQTLYPGVELGAQGLKVDVLAILGQLLSGELEIAGMPVNLNFADFLLGIAGSELLDNSAITDSKYLNADKTAALFALLDALGLLDMIQDMGLAGLTQLIQYGKFMGPKLIDYGLASSEADVAKPPKWFKEAHAQFLVENVDGVLEWAWSRLIAGDPDVKARLEQLLSDLINGTDSDPNQDPDPDPDPNPDPDPDPGPMPGRNSVAIQGASNVLHPLAVLLLTLDNPVQTGDRFDVFDMIDTITALIEQLTPEPEPCDVCGEYPCVCPCDVCGEYPCVCEPEPPKPIDLSGIIKDTFQETIQGIFGVDFFVKDNLTMLVDLVLGLKDSVAEYSDMIKRLIFIGNAPLDLDLLFAPFEAYDPEAVTIENGADFMAVLIDLLQPFVPLLDVFLTGSNILLFKDPRFTGTETDPAIEGINDQGFLRVYGYDGYRTGLLPLFAGLAASFPGMLGEIMDYDTFKDATDGEKLGAVIGPILTLLDALASKPVDTLLKLLPNLIYIVSGKNGGLLDDLLGSLGFDLRELIVGTITLLPNGFEVLGVNGETVDQASYVDVDLPQLLIQLLHVTGAFDMIEGTGFAGLVELLNYPGRTPEQFGPVDYPAVSITYDPYSGGWFWTRRDAVAMLDKLPGLVDNVLAIFLGESLEDMLRNLMGDSLFKQTNFDGIVGALQEALAELDLNIALIPGKNEGDPPLKTLGDLLEGIVKIGGEDVDVLGILDALKNWEASGEITGRDSFISELADFLAPAVPLLDWLLFGKDITVLVGEEKINGGAGLLKAFGYDGYQYGLIPIYEALLKPLGAGFETKIKSANTLKAMTDPVEKLKALLDPLLCAVDEVVANPLESLLKLLPTVAYFAGVKNSSGKTPLEASLNNALFSATSLVGTVLGEPMDVSGLLALLLGDENFKLDVPALLDELLLEALGIPGLGNTLLNNLLLGTPEAYNSLSGEHAVFLALRTEEDRADLLTAILRTFLAIAQGNGNQEYHGAFVKALANIVIPEGEFGNLSLRWGLHFILWVSRLFGTDLTLAGFHGLVSFLSWFLPIIRWFMDLFNTVGSWFKF